MKNTAIAGISNDQLDVVRGGDAETVGQVAGAAAGCAAGIRYVPGSWPVKAAACIIGATGLADWGGTAGAVIDDARKQATPSK